MPARATATTAPRKATSRTKTAVAGRALKPLTPRRARTRRRLLDAALEVFAEEGFGRTTVDQVCERAGFSRGAFYSNFTSLDELFLAMWEERAARMNADLRAALDEATRGPAARSAGPEELLRAALEVVPVDEAWYRVTAEFTAHALRNPPLRAVVAARENAITDALMPMVERALGAAGRRATDAGELASALVAVHDGTTVQLLVEGDGPGAASARERRVTLFLNVLQAYSTPVAAPAPDTTEGSP